MAYKSALNLSQNTEEVSFGEVVGMLRAHELELDGVTSETRKPTNLALTSCERREGDTDNEEDSVSLLVRRFDKALRRVERGQGLRKFGSFNKQTEADKNNKKSEVKCFICKGFGHYKTDYPIVKRREMKCFGCKGIGHTQTECENDQKPKSERSSMAEENSEEATDDEEVLNNFVTFVGIVNIDEA